MHTTDFNSYKTVHITFIVYSRQNKYFKIILILFPCWFPENHRVVTSPMSPVSCYHVYPVCINLWQLQSKLWPWPVWPSQPLWIKMGPESKPVRSIMSSGHQLLGYKDIISQYWNVTDIICVQAGNKRECTSSTYSMYVPKVEMCK